MLCACVRSYLLFHSLPKTANFYHFEGDARGDIEHIENLDYFCFIKSSPESFKMGLRKLFPRFVIL